MKQIVTIGGKPVIEIYESLDGSYWFITEKAFTQDSLINGKVYKNDQILFGYVRLSALPDCAEWGYISTAELKLLYPSVWQVPKFNWHLCPLVQRTETQGQEQGDEGRETPQPADHIIRELKGGDEYGI